MASIRIEIETPKDFYQRFGTPIFAKLPTNDRKTQDLLAWFLGHRALGSRFACPVDLCVLYWQMTTINPC